MRSYILAVIICFICGLAGFSSADCSLNQSLFPLGVWYSGGVYRAPTTSKYPLNERTAWLADLQMIKSLGFNHVKTWVDWASAEAVQGSYNFDGLAQLLDLANTTGLCVIIQMYG